MNFAQAREGRSQACQCVGSHSFQELLKNNVLCGSFISVTVFGPHLSLLGTSCLLPGPNAFKTRAPAQQTFRVCDVAGEIQVKDRMLQEAILLLYRLPHDSTWPLSLLPYPEEAVIEQGPDSENWVMHNLAHKQFFLSPIQGGKYRGHKNKMSTLKISLFLVLCVCVWKWCVCMFVQVPTEATGVGSRGLEL